MSNVNNIAQFDQIDFTELNLGDLDMDGVEVVETPSYMALPETGASCCSCCNSCCCSLIL